jgi:opacity protein-like surface antigen
MNRWKLMLAAAVVGSVVMGVRAEDKKIKFFGQIEYLTYSDAFEKNEKLTKDTAADISGLISESHDTGSGVGFRIGALTDSSLKGIAIGGSLGYIMGPSYEGKINYDNGTPKTDVTKNSSNLWRLMAEAKYSYPIGDKFEARLGLGLGLATLKVEEEYSETGEQGYDKSLTTTKMTWEIGPAIAFVTEKVGVELALTYSQMPSAENMETFQEFDWNPFGVRLGVEF